MPALTVATCRPLRQGFCAGDETERTGDLAHDSPGDHLVSCAALAGQLHSGTLPAEPAGDAAERR